MIRGCWIRERPDFNERARRRSRHQELGKLTAVDPRTVWQHEAYDFSPRLLEHADALADVLGIDLELIANEHPVGGFALDLIGRNLNNDCVLIVENTMRGRENTARNCVARFRGNAEAETAQRGVMSMMFFSSSETQLATANRTCTWWRMRTKSRRPAADPWALARLLRIGAIERFALWLDSRHGNPTL
jgi:hypothetical protein